MEKEQYEEAREFARSLNAKRQLMSDGALLDQCQQHLDALVAHLADDFEEHPQEIEGEEEPPPPPRQPYRNIAAAEPEPEPQGEHPHEAPRHLTHHRGKSGKKHK